jgi:hypothetical protein
VGARAQLALFSGFRIQKFWIPSLLPASDFWLQKKTATRNRAAAFKDDLGLNYTPIWTVACNRALQLLLSKTPPETSSSCSSVISGLVGMISSLMVGGVMVWLMLVG